VSAALAYSPLLARVARRYQSIRLHRTVFNDGYLPVMCESRNFESIFGPLAILHPRSHPRPQLHVSPSCRLRHVTKPTVTYMTDFWFCLRCHFSILEFKFANAVTSLLLTCVASVVDPRFKLIAFESTPTNGVRWPLVPL